ncbi:hypothetical protein [Aeromicrobium sp.]|uniref:hypothetical protein n=1 Tax=Aeromicrobium sp. TaxID=1871063 RepID=UPI003C35E722
MAADFKALSKNQQGALIAGGVSIILSFFPRFVAVDLGPLGSNGISAWHSYGVLAMFLILAATAIVAVRAFATGSLPDGPPWSLITLALAGLGTVLLILRSFTYGYSNPGWSGYLLFISTLALTYFAYLLFKESGEKMPEVNKKGTPPAA